MPPAPPPPDEPAPAPTRGFDPDATPGGDVLAGVAKRFRILADTEFHGYSPAYERIARRLAEDPGPVADLVGVTAERFLPVLTLAAVHELALREPRGALARAYADGTDPWPAFHDVLTTRLPEIRATMATRRIQTNEVGRAAVLLPTCHLLEQRHRRPLALVEIGASAGLNLYFDEFAYHYRGGNADPETVLGDPDSPVQLHCELVGDGHPPLPPPGVLPTVVARDGIDLHPVDVTDPAARRWLRACLWPGLPERAERLDGALALALADPPTLFAGNALDLLAGVLAALPESALAVVSSTWVLAYFDPDERARFWELLQGCGRARDLAVVTGEFPTVVPWVPAAPSPPSMEGRGASLVGLATWSDGACTTEALAWVHPHGRWLEWFG